MVEEHEGVTLADMSHVGVANRFFRQDTVQKRFERMSLDTTEVNDDRAVMYMVTALLGLPRRPLVEPVGDRTGELRRAPHPQPGDGPRVHLRQRAHQLAMGNRIANSNRVLAIMVAFATSACAPSVGAQLVSRPPPPSEHECRVLLNKLGANPNSEAFRDALRSNIAACGTSGAQGIASALERASSGSVAPEVVEQFRFVVAYNRSPVLLETLLHVVDDAGASPEMRILAIEGVVRQFDLSFGFRTSIGELARSPGAPICQTTYIEHAGEYKSNAPLQPGSRDLAVAELNSVSEAADSTATAAVRHAARCAAAYLRRAPDSAG